MIVDRLSRAHRPWVGIVVVTLVAGLLASSCSYGVAKKVKTVTVKAVHEDDVLRTTPRVEVVSTPTAETPRLQIALKRRLYGPVYAVDVIDEETKKVTYNPLRTVGAAAVTAMYGIGLLMFLASPDKAKTLAWAAGFESQSAGMRTVRSKPRKTDEFDEIEVPWPHGTVRVRVGEQPLREVTADSSGVVLIDLVEHFRTGGEYPMRPVSVVLTAVIGAAQDAKTVDVDTPVVREAYLRSIDMSNAGTDAAPYPIASFGLEEGKTALTAGSATDLVVEVKNLGKGTTSQLKGVIESRHRSFNGHELLFGRIGPGQRRVWRQSIALPNHEESGEVEIRIAFSEAVGYVPEDIHAKLRIVGRGRPRFGYAVQVLDGGTERSVGNRDGRIQRGEAVDLVVYLKNVGTDLAGDVDARIDFLPRSPADQRRGAVLKVDRQRVRALAAGETVALRFEVHVLRAFRGSELALQFSVGEGTFGARFDGELRVPIDRDIERRPIEVRRRLRVRVPSAAIHGGAGRDTSLLGTLRRGGDILATGEFGDWFRVEWGAGRIGWVAAADVEPISDHAGGGTRRPDEPPTVVELYRNSPPTIAVATPRRDDVVDGASVRLHGVINDRDGVAAVTVSVNGRPLDAPAVERGLRRPDASTLELDLEIPVAVGHNVIQIVATNREKLTGEERRRVTRVEPRVAAGRAPPLEPVSDVDREILSLPEPREPDPRRWAVVIGVERYQRASRVSFARRDAYAVHELARKALRVPPENTFLLVDEEATHAQMKVVLADRLLRNVRQGDVVFVFYAGHGMPDPASREPYLLPVDANPESVRLSGYSLHELFLALGQLKAGRVVVFLDACFSGISGRDATPQPLLADARPAILAVTDPVAVSRTLTLVTAAKHDQLSNADADTGHGLFTYHVLKGLLGAADLDRDARVQLRELALYVVDTVHAAARRRFGETRAQTPTVSPADIDAGRDLELVRR